MTSTLTEADICNQALDFLKEHPITSLTDGSPEAAWFTRNYATTRDAELRKHPWKFSIKRRKLFPRDYLLAGLSGTLTGAWGTFRLTENWSGDLIRIRRSSDSTTDDFPVDDAGMLVDLSLISTFVGSGTGFVDRLFDQSGNGRSLLNADTTRQPTFEAEEEASTLPAVSFNGSDDILATAGAMSTLISTTAGYVVIAGLIDALTLDSATAASNHMLFGEAASTIGMWARAGGTLYGFNNDGSGDTITDAVPLLVPFVAELRHLSGTLYARVNGEGEQSVASGTTSSLAGVFCVGDDSGGANALDFHLFACMTFSVAPTEAERNRLVERLMRWVRAGGANNVGWSYRYPVPDDSLRMLPLRTDGYWEGEPVQHEIEQEYILTNNSSYIWSRYIQKVTDPTRFDPMFVEALAAKLAFKMAHWLTGKASMAQTMMGIYNQAISEAKGANSIEGTVERAAGDDVINARYA